MSLALSTSWNAFRHTDGKKIVSEIKDLGFELIELSFNLPRAAVEDIASLVDKKEIKVSSLHNYCPIPDGLRREEALPDRFSLASPDEEERLKAIKLTKITMETCERLQAKAVVLHTGRIEVGDRTKDLIDLYNRGLKDSKEFRDLKQDMIKERSERSGLFFENTLRSLEELEKEAGKRNILLGVETRFYYREIPFLDELSLILEKFKGSRIGYWHDTGHAQLMENLGFCRHLDFLQAAKGRLLGAHLHNIIGCSDHQPPSQGQIDFRMLKPFVEPRTFKVIEAHHPATAEQIRNSKKMLEEIFDGNGKE